MPFTLFCYHPFCAVPLDCENKKDEKNTPHILYGIEMSNYKMTDKIYRREDDRKRAKRSIPVTVIYTLTICVGMGMTGIVFEVRGIDILHFFKLSG